MKLAYFSVPFELALPTMVGGVSGALGGYAGSRRVPVQEDENNPNMTDVYQTLQDGAAIGIGTSYGAALGLGGGVLLSRLKQRQGNFSTPLVPNVPFQDAPPGVRPLVLGSQVGALVGGGMGLENTIQDAQEEGQPLPKAIAKGALNVAGGATLGTLTGLGGGVLLNRARGINNTDALNYANKFTFGEASMSYMSNSANFGNLVPIGAGLGAVKGMLDQPEGQLVDPASGQIVSRTYTPLERLTNIGINAGVGAGLGFGANKLGLNDPRKVGRYMGRASAYAEDKLQQAQQYLPEVEIRTKPIQRPLRYGVDER